ncbi:hypothetical protein [Xanthomonas cerealis]|uniref:hypothetical protein n=1 Tax=Xanthomonas cerealis TaxID=3390025 RepID=UPI000579102C|nr:hypothetical protein [Xanthomonas translucens]UKE48309.1 hypothetical protein KHA79_06685 [Xanthomonas translucens pv. cerealis]UKE70723.1 hypothetical protein K8O61_06760 [Xanthomonas translucens pv. pistacia]
MLRFSKFDIIRKAALPIIAVSAVLSAGSAAAAETAKTRFEIESHVGKAKALMLSGSGSGVGCYELGHGIVTPDDPLMFGVVYTAIAMSDPHCRPGTGMAGFHLDFQPSASDITIVIYSSGITTM